MEQIGRNRSDYREHIPSQDDLIPQGHPATNPFADPNHAAETTPAGHPTAAPTTEQPKIPFYKTRKFIIFQIVNGILGIIILFILLFPVVKAIAQHVINVSYLNVNTAAITNPQNNTFQLHMLGNVSHAGGIPARIEFTKSIQVTWISESGPVKLGEVLNFPDIHARHKRADINATTPFNITDEDAFADFTKFMITQPEFTWRLTSDSIKVHALKFPVAKGIHFNKTITLKGINNFENKIRLLDFKLPHDDPAGGITFAAVTQLTNQSPFQVDLGTTVFDLSYNGIPLGQGSSPATSLIPGDNTITLNGRLVPHNNSQSDLFSLGTLFTNYINSENSFVKATGVSTTQANGQEIGWLSQGLQALSLDVPFVPMQPINPIQSIEISYFNLSFSEDQPYAPLASTDQVTASMKLPFGFSVNVSQIRNSFAIRQNGTDIANLTTPLGASVSDIRVYGPEDTHGTINITISNIPLNIPDSQRQAFALFNEQLTDSSVSTFQLIGGASAVSELPIGTITLNPIKFNVTSSLLGLQGLQGSTIIRSVDVIGGTPDHINLKIGLSIHNPSNLNLNLGDLSLQLFSQGAILGTSLLSNLTLLRGDNDGLEAAGFFTPNNSPAGLDTLNKFVAGQNTTVDISGYDGSTNITSLLPAFKSLHINATLPGLNSTLLKSASLEVLPTTGHGNTIAHTTVNLENPFTGGLTVTSINSSIHSHGILLGTINTSTNFVAPGKKVSTSPNLDLNMNLDPPSVFTVLRALAVDSGLSTAQIDGIVQIGGIQYLQATDADSPGNSTRKRSFLEAELGFEPTMILKRNIFTGFNLPDFVDKAFKNLKTDITIESGVSIGDYKTTLNYVQTNVPVETDSSLNLLLPILAQPIVQKVVDQSLLGIDTVTITDPAEKSFGTVLSGSITNAGPFDAKITFPEGLTVLWSGSPLGKINMPDVNVVGDVGAKINNKGTFEVADVNHLADFTKTLLTSETFDWTITGNNLSVTALGITVPGISLGAKNVTLKAFNGLKNGVKVNSFDLPSNNPAGGIHLTLNTSITNPSQVGISLNKIGFQNFVGSTNLGPAESENPFMMAPQSTFDLPLVGRLIPQTSDSGLATISQVFTDFIHGKSTEVTVKGDFAGPPSVTWLNEGIKVLSLTTTLPSLGVLDVIKSISLNELKLLFTVDTTFSPSTSTNDATAAFQLPFGFPLDVTEVGQTITANFQGTDFATLSVPMSPAKTDVKNRIIHLTFQNIPFAVHDNAHDTFEQFLKQTTASKSETFSLSGSASTKAQTAVGLLTINDIAFSNLDTTIAGLQNLNVKPAQVSNLDVNHGFPDFLLIKVDTTLFNPSNLTIGTGDVSFNLQFQGKTIGVADLSDLLLVPGSANYSTDVHYQPSGDAEDAGQQLLANYIQGTSSDTTISGSDDTTAIDSLKPALAQISLGATIPALHQNLITATHIEIPQDIVKTGIAMATFDLFNPFTASINLLRISTSAVFHNITLGTIDIDGSNNPIHAGGHSNITSPELPLKFNLDPTAIIELLAIRAKEKNIDLGPLPELFQIALANPDLGKNISSVPDTKPPTCSSGKQFDVDGAILNALEGLQVDLAIDSTVKLDDFETPLKFAQHNVPAVTDKSALFLIGAVANPVTQALVNQAQLSFKVANISNLSNEGFDLELDGSLTNTGPLDALIEFTEPVTVTWQGRKIAGITLPSACAAANVGIPHYTPKAHLTITDLSAFTDFATFLLHNEEFTWDLSSNTVRVTALNTIFSGVTLTKSVSFKAFNGLPGVSISNFQLPSDSPQGGIAISTDSLIPSPAQLSIELGTVSFESFFNGVDLGPLTGQHLFLAADATTRLHLDGRIMPQSGDALNTIGDLFSAFLAGKNSTLQVKGVSVDPNGNGQDVSWLSTAFKSLTLNVVLPGEGNLTIIESITINDLELVMTEQSEAFAPLASSKDTLATYKNPFGFSLQVIEAATQIILGGEGLDVAQLNLPKAPADGGVSTGNIADLHLSFQNQTLKSLNDEAFSLFFILVTDSPSVPAQLRGTADVTAKTTIGNVPISGIPFNVNTKFAGFNFFGHEVSLSNVSITGSGGDGGSQFVVSPLINTLNNPSNISLATIDISLPTFFKGVEIGRALVSNFDLVPGKNSMPAEFHYQPANANDTTAQSFLTEFLSTGDNIPLTISGDGQSSPIASLNPALQTLKLSTSLTGANARLIQHINVFITVQSLLTGFVSIDIDIANPLDTDLTILFLQSDAGVNGETFAHVDFAFEPGFVVPAHGTANSGRIPNVNLTQGVIASLPIIPLGRLDVFSAITNQVGKDSGYTIPWLQYSQLDVPTEYQFPLGVNVGNLKPLMESLANSASSSATATGTKTSDIPTTTGASGSSDSRNGSSQPSPTPSSDVHPTSSADTLPSPASEPSPSPKAEPTPTSTVDSPMTEVSGPTPSSS